MPFEHRVVITGPDTVRVEVTYFKEKRSDLTFPQKSTFKQQDQLKNTEIEKLKFALLKEICQDLKLQEVKSK